MVWYLHTAYSCVPALSTMTLRDRGCSKNQQRACRLLWACLGCNLVFLTIFLASNDSDNSRRRLQKQDRTQESLRTDQHNVTNSGLSLRQDPSATAAIENGKLEASVFRLATPPTNHSLWISESTAANKPANCKISLEEEGGLNSKYYASYKFLADYLSHAACNDGAQSVGHLIHAMTGPAGEIALDANLTFLIDKPNYLIHAATTRHQPHPLNLVAERKTANETRDGFTLLLVAVLSLHAADKARRDHLRQQMSPSKADLQMFPLLTRPVFFLPRFATWDENQLVGQEDQETGDIVQTDVNVSEPNFVALQELAVLWWIWRHQLSQQHSISYIVLLQESVDISPSALVRLINAERFAANRIYGVLKKGLKPPHGGTAIAVSKRGKVGNSSSATRGTTGKSWPWPQLPPFLAGQVRIFTPDTIPRLLHSCVQVPILPPSTVWLTGLVAVHARIIRMGVSSLARDSISNNEDR